MTMIKTYIDKLISELDTKSAREHSYRPALKDLFEEIDPNVKAVNEPSRSAHGAPDFAFYKSTNNNLVLGYVETKDIYVDLDQVEKTEQLKRYLGYANLILTNYLEFRFFRNGVKYQNITIADLNDSIIKPNEADYPILERELKAFLEGKPETITSAKRLSEIMGGKAARIRDNVISYLKIEHERNKELLRIYNVMQKLLVHDLTIEKFADMYAQTLVYGLFVARYYDETPENFTRQEARDLVPASNPFLQHFFDHIVGPDFDPRLKYIVDELCDVFSVSAVRETVSQHYNLFGEAVDKDPVIHFYEDFLKEYDPILKKNMGAYYTPVPVVQFIIHAVDDVLKKEFHLSQGIADTSKIERTIMQQGTKAKQILHKVQILDPAVGTATFLNETVKFLYEQFKGQEGVWQSYVENELLPRLHGFELMMAPYTIAHLKLAMTFKETGIDQFDRRLGIYLTNTLEEGVQTGKDLFSFGLAEAISEEAQAASVIKHETPIMIVMGNPPYSGESFNKGAFAMQLVDKYKYEPDSKEKLKERNPKWINDDYVKFLAFSEKMITDTGEGIIAMITNHGYLDNPTFRGMRWHLANTFSSIYVLDLHGNAKKREVAPDGGIDKNVFDIQQGVSIIVAVKRKDKKKGLADVYRADIRGTRKTKFDFLLGNTIDQVKWENINLAEPFYFFQNRNQKIEKDYIKGIKINELFINNSLAFQTHRDYFAICDSRDEVLQKLADFQNSLISEAELKTKYSLKDNRDWQLSKARTSIRDEKDVDRLIIKCSYRPFDYKWTYFDEGFSDYPRSLLKKHMLNHQNFSIEISKQISNLPWQHIFISDLPAESCLVSNKTKEGNYSIPLYLYTDPDQDTIEHIGRRSNLNSDLVKHLLANIGSYEWIDDHLDKNSSDKNKISPLDVLDYIYATLHSPSYREKYKDFLKSDFPRVPIAKDTISFWELVNLGGKLRQMHLMEDPDLAKLSTTYPVSGENEVEKVEYHDGNVFINEAQYFGNVPKEAWEFYMGGYQPAQKWLKDRKSKNLIYEDINHYQKIIKVLSETSRIIEKIDGIQNY
jgi:predicted helicase